MKTIQISISKRTLDPAKEEKLRRLEYQFLEAIQLRQRALDPKVFKPKPSVKKL